MVIAIAELTEEKRERGVPQLTHISFHRPHLFILNIFIIFNLFVSTTFTWLSAHVTLGPHYI